jgi:branched-subunit amino acid transport protein
MSQTAPWWPWLLLLGGALVTYAWRALGAAISGRIAPDGALFEWVSAVAYAMLAALTSLMVVTPLGALAETPLVDRLIGVAVALAGYLLARRGLLAGVVAGVIAMIALSYARRHGLI